MNQLAIAPSMLSADYGHLAAELKRLNSLPIDYVHFDVMDGSFVPRISFGSDCIAGLRQYSNLKFDVHLMVDQPERHIPVFAAAGADSITFHIETTKHAYYAVQLVKEAEKKVCIALNPATPIDSIFDIIHTLDMVLLMSVNPGVTGQKFIPDTLNKVQALREYRSIKGLDFKIEIDGGINEHTIQSVRKAGVDIAVAGRSFFSAEIREFLYNSH